MHYLRIWKQLTSCAVSSYLSNRIDAVTLLSGKLARFGFFFVFLLSLFQFTDTVAGYGPYEVLLFFLTFNLLDVGSQTLFRGIYIFGRSIRSGDFDYILSKPVNTLFFSVSRLNDILDFLFLIPIVGFIIWDMGKLPIQLAVPHIGGYALFCILGLIIILSIHIITAAIMIWTVEANNVIWLYREFMTLGRLPPEIFTTPIQYIFTFLLPIIVIVAFPTKVLLGILSPAWMLAGVAIAAIFFTFSILLWKKALRTYSSASS